MTSTAVSDLLISVALLAWGGARFRTHLQLAGRKDPRDLHEYLPQRGKR